MFAGGQICPVLQRNMALVMAVIRIHMFLGLPDPNLLVKGMDPDPSIIKQK